MGLPRALALLIAAAAVGGLVVSGGSGADPRTPPALPGMPPPFLGVAVLGDGGLTAAIDAYGDVVDLRSPGPASPARIDNPSARQAAGTAAPGTGIQPWARVGGKWRPLWRADWVGQRYLPGTDVLRTRARFGRVGVRIAAAARGRTLALRATGAPVEFRGSAGRGCSRAARGRSLLVWCPGSRPPGPGNANRAIARSIGADRRWLARASALGRSAPAWAGRMYRRSLLVLRALSDRRTGAVAAGARDGWAYVWPRDAATAALAFEAAGYRGEARRAARFLLGLHLGAAARFDGGGNPVPGRGPQGDAAGWVAVAARAAGVTPPARPLRWRDLPDYQEGAPGNYLANAIASGETAIRQLYGGRSQARLLREPGDPDSGLDSAAAWAVRPFPEPRLFPAVRTTLERLVAQGTPYGIAPGEAWPGRDPWTAPTAWSAWALAALGERRQSLRLLGDLRRAATAAGELPERVGAHTGIPRSTTPLAWSHAFAILALLELWPAGEPGERG
jgi:glucoamylase